MTSCPDDDTLAAIATLPERERAVIADHAATCETCRSLVADLLDVRPPPLGEAETLDESASSAVARAEQGMPPKIDRYRIDRRIGAGAMGVVYGGRDPELDRPVAIKVLKIGGSPERMRREAQALAKLAHPNVVAVYDVGEHDGATFVTMALVDGDNFRTWLQTERTTRQIIDVIMQAGRGLEAAHKRGIVHRDIKPDNIFVARSGDVLVGDFGLARSSADAPESVKQLDVSIDELTRTGALVGTPAYMAPEQVEGEATAASDQFALCVTAWEALYGARPFSGKSIAELVLAVRAGPPADGRRRSPEKVPSHVHAAIARGLAAEPSARHPSISAMLAALLPPKRRRWPYLAAGAAALATAGIVAFALREDSAKACNAIAAPSGWTIPATSRPALATTLETVLDRYATSWGQLAKASCLAAAKHELPEALYAATKRCLARRSDALAWITAKQSTEPADLLGLAEALEPIESCKLLSPDDPPSAELVTLQRDLSRATAIVHSAPDKATGLGDLLARAMKLDDPTAIAEASYLLAISQHVRGRDPTEHLRRGLTAAERARDDRMRTRISALLAIVAARKGLITEATMHRDVATSAVARASDPVTTIAVERAIIELAFVRGDTATEIAAMRRIEALQRARFGELSASLVEVRFTLGGALHRANDPETAKVFALAIEGAKQLTDVGPELLLEQMSVTERSPAARIPLQEQIIAIFRREDPARLPLALKTIAYDFEIVGSYDRALQAAREALALPEHLLPNHETELLEDAASFALAIAEGTDDAALRTRRLDDALAFVDQLPGDMHDRDSVQSIRGRALLLAGRYLEAMPHLSAALVAAERAEPQHPYRIAVRAFSLAQALWEVGGARDRDRALALVEQAAKRMPEARALYAADEQAYGSQLQRLDDVAARIDAWRRTHR